MCCIKNPQIFPQLVLGDIIAERRLWMADHIMRMPPERPANHAMLWTPRGSGRRRVRPTKTWRSTFKEDLVDRGVNWNSVRAVATNMSRGEPIVLSRNGGSKWHCGISAGGSEKCCFLVFWRLCILLHAYSLQETVLVDWGRRRCLITNPLGSNNTKCCRLILLTFSNWKNLACRKLTAQQCYFKGVILVGSFVSALQSHRIDRPYVVVAVFTALCTLVLSAVL